MRSGKSLLVLLVVALGLGAYIYFVEMKRDPGEGEKKARVFTVDSTGIDEIEVKAASGEVTTLKRTGDVWSLVSPVTAKADEDAVVGITSGLALLEVDKVLDENPASLSEFGLEPARYTVGFKAGDGTLRRLKVGNKTPTGSSLYAQVEGEKRLILTPATNDEAFNRTSFALRDKHVLAFSRNEADSLTLQAKGTPVIAASRKTNDWRLTAPVDARADFSPVDGIVGRLDQIRMTSIVAEGAEPTPAQLKQFGLDAPQMIATVGAGSAKATLAIGAKKDDTSLYARDLSRPIIFTVESALLTDLAKKPGDLRLKDVFEFKAFSAKQLDITHGTTAVSYRKISKPAGAAADAAPSDVWSQTKPAAKDVNQTAFADLLNTVTSMRVDHFVDSAPGSGDDLVVVARSGDDTVTTEERVTLRKSGNAVYAIRGGEAGAGVVQTGDFDKALAQLKTLLDAK